MRLRSALYRAARILGDVDAIMKGRYAQRLARKAAYRTTGGLLRRVLRLFGL